MHEADKSRPAVGKLWMKYSNFMHRIHSCVHEATGVSRFRQQLFSEGQELSWNSTWSGLGEPDHIHVVFRDHVKDKGATLRGHANAGRYFAARDVLFERQDPDDQSRHGHTALYLASKAGHHDIVNLLLIARASVSLASNTGSTPLLAAFVRDHKDIVQSLHLARADAGSFGTHLTNDGRDLNQWLSDDETFLWRAVRAGMPQAVQSLLTAAADANVALLDGYTPLHLAAQMGATDMVRALLEARADKDRQADNGRTPIFMASIWSQCSVVEQLLESGASANRTDQYGCPAVVEAAEQNEPKVVQSLLRGRADVAQWGGSLLMCAVRTQSCDAELHLASL